MKSVRPLAAAIAATLALGGAPAIAREGAPQPVVTQHRLPLPTGELRYSAEVGQIPIRDTVTGEVHANMFYVAYRVAPKAGEVRPVTFLWGGGPGGPSGYVDAEIAGPLRGSGPRRIGPDLQPNQETWLTDTDLVFIDAVGAGFSRPTRREYAQEFYGTIGDTDAFVEFIRTYSLRHDTQQAPIFIGGISWGAPRAATVGYQLLRRGLPLRGEILITGETSINDRPLPPLEFEALRVVGMAQVAYFHRRLAPDVGASEAEVTANAEAWVRSTYIPALAARETLTSEQRTEIAAGVAHYTGIAQADIDLSTLVIGPIQFRKGLLGDHDLTLYGSDTRLTAPLRLQYMPNYLERLRTDLGYRDDLPYQSLGMNAPAGVQARDLELGYAPSRDLPKSVQEQWEWRTSPISDADYQAIMTAFMKRGGGPPSFGAPLPGTQEAVALAPHLKVLAIIGRYDGESTCASNAELHRRLDPPMQRALTIRCYDAGHSPTRTPGVAQQLSTDVKAMIRDALAERP